MRDRSGRCALGERRTRPSWPVIPAEQVVAKDKKAKRTGDRNYGDYDEESEEEEDEEEGEDEGL